MTIQELKIEIKKSLADLYTSNETKIISHALIEKHLNLKAFEVLLKLHQVIEEDVQKAIQKDLIAISEGKPYQYVMGYTWFYDLKIGVNSSVLIPRPETEELVHWIVERNATTIKIDIIDIGTGSGCIALAIKSKLKNSAVTGVDISSEALQTAQQNATINKLAVHFELFDVLNYLPNKQSALFDVVVSNPPYIPIKEKEEMDKMVTENEPELALFIPDENPLLFYEHICRYARQYLKPKGQLYFEIHENYSEEVKNTLLKFGFSNIELKKDLQGKQRMICGIL